MTTRLARRRRRARRPARFAAAAFGLALCALLFALGGAHARQQQTQPQPSAPRPTPQQSPAPPQPAAAPARPARVPLTEQERRGKLIYLRGESATPGREITATLNEVEVPGATLTCAGCHGQRAEGKTEAGVTAGALAWSHLTKSYGHTHPTGRKHGPFTEMSFIRSVTAGTDPAGNTLLVAMPRYRMTAEDMADLIAYLKRVETDTDPGVTDTTITLGLVAPAKGALAETAQAVRAATAAYFDDLNKRGGVYNRRVELKVSEAGETAADLAAAYERLAGGGEVFALVNSFTAGAERETAAIVARHEVPLVGPFTLLTPAATTPARHTFYLLAGVDEQARALVNFAARRPALTKDATFAVVNARTVPSEAAAVAASEQLRAAGRPAPARVSYAPGAFDAAATVAQLKGANARAVVFLGAGDEAKFFEEAARAGWFPEVYLLGAMTGAGVLEAPAGFKDKIFLSFPTAPSDVTPEGLGRFRALSSAYALGARHVGGQLSAVAAAQLLTEALKRAGQDLTREKLITALEGLYEYQTGLTPPLTYGPNRRIGAAGAHIIAADLEKKQYTPAGGWVGSRP